MGAKYAPSIIYKARHITIQSGQTETTAEWISDIELEAVGQ